MIRYTIIRWLHTSPYKYGYNGVRIPLHIVYYTPGLVRLNHPAGPSEAQELSYTGLLRYQHRLNTISTDGMHGSMHANGLVIYGVRGNKIKFTRYVRLAHFYYGQMWLNIWTSDIRKMKSAWVGLISRCWLVVKHGYDSECDRYRAIATNQAFHV